jgi:biopolymer transport protein ExbD
MKLSLPRPEEPDVNLTPMIDVVFLLLLFFMVSTSFIRESSLKVDLPEAAGQPSEGMEDAIEIAINSEGHFILDGISISAKKPSQLAKLLKKLVNNDPTPHIIIAADANVEYQLIVTVMDVAQQLGYTRLTLSTRKTSEAVVKPE